MPSVPLSQAFLSGNADATTLEFRSAGRCESDRITRYAVPSRFPASTAACPAAENGAAGQSQPPPLL
jgi:hypothetical protein